MNDSDDPSTPRFFSKQKGEIDDILSDIDNDLSDDVMDIESFDDMPSEPLKAQKPFGGSKSSLGGSNFRGGLSSSRRSSSSTLLMGTILGLLVVGGAGGAYYYFTQGNSYSTPRKIAAPLTPPPTPDMAMPTTSPAMDGVGGDVTTLPSIDGAVVPSPDMVAGTNVPTIPSVPNQDNVITPPVANDATGGAALPTDTSPPTLDQNSTAPQVPTTPVTPAVGETTTDTVSTNTTPAVPVTAPVPTAQPSLPEMPKADGVAATAETPAPTDPSKTALTATSKTDKVTKPSTKPEAIKYFDSPAGEVLEDIQPPSIDVTRNPGESIIIVKKPVGYDRGYADGAYSNVGDGTVKIERSEASNTMSQKAIMADRALRLGRYDMAIGYYQEILAQNQNDVSALLGRAIAYQKSGNNDAALQGYRDVLRRDPSNVTAATNMAGLQSGSNPNSALKNLSNVYNADPNNTSVKAQMGVSMAQSGNVEDAYNVFLGATKSEPRNPVHFYNLAVTAEKLGKRSEAIAAYEKCLEVDAIYGTGRGINRDAIYDRLSQIRG